jgi:D-3-phosphoglycerate dehydrogenase / 2-oxoglutarate reductase
MTRTTVLILGDLDRSALARISRQFSLIHEQAPAKIGALERACAIVVRSPHCVTKAMMDSAPKLRHIIRAGSGTDNIDLEAAAFRGIAVHTTPASASAVAENIFALLLAIARDTPALHASMVCGKWLKSSALGFELSGRRMVIVGFGRVGRHATHIALGFGMSVTIVDPTPHKPEKRKMIDQLGLRICSLDDALRTADVLTLCCPGSPETHRMINARRFALLPKGAVVINVARGSVLDTDALAQALDAGCLAGAGLDVHDNEPPGPMPLFAKTGVIASPHVGAQTVETQARIGHLVEELLLRLFPQTDEYDCFRKQLNRSPGGQV